MGKKPSIEKDAFEKLAAEVSELNKRLSNTNSFSFENRRGYLFGFTPTEKTAREIYTKHIIFMKIITQVLNDFGIHMANNGYSYIIDSVMFIIDRQSLDVRLSNDIYPYVALKNDFSKGSTVEHNIRNAIRSACVDYERDPGSNMMGIFGKKPTNKQFLFYVAETVSRRMCEEMMPVAC